MWFNCIGCEHRCLHQRLVQLSVLRMVQWSYQRFVQWRSVWSVQQVATSCEQLCCMSVTCMHKYYEVYRALEIVISTGGIVHMVATEMYTTPR